MKPGDLIKVCGDIAAQHRRVVVWNMRMGLEGRRVATFVDARRVCLVIVFTTLLHGRRSAYDGDREVLLLVNGTLGWALARNFVPCAVAV